MKKMHEDVLSQALMNPRLFRKRYYTPNTFILWSIFYKSPTLVLPNKYWGILKSVPINIVLLSCEMLNYHKHVLAGGATVYGSKILIDQGA